LTPQALSKACDEDFAFRKAVGRIQIPRLQSKTWLTQGNSAAQANQRWKIEHSEFAETDRLVGSAAFARAILMRYPVRYGHSNLQSSTSDGGSDCIACTSHG
jgi:hypothetical protein